MDTSVLRARMGLKDAEIKEEIRKKTVDIRFWTSEKNLHKKHLEQLIREFNECISLHNDAKTNIAICQSQLRGLHKELDELESALKVINDMESTD